MPVQRPHRPDAPRLDAFIKRLVVECLAGSHIWWGRGESKRAVNLVPLRTRRAALQALLDDLAAKFLAPEIGRSQLRRGSGDLRTQIAGIDTVLAEAAQTSPLAALALAADEDTTLIDHWVAASADIQSKVIAELMDVVVMPGPKGTRGTRGLTPV